MDRGTKKVPFNGDTTVYQPVIQAGGFTLFTAYEDVPIKKEKVPITTGSARKISKK